MIKVYNAVNACVEYADGRDIEFVTVAGYAAKGLRVYDQNGVILSIWMPHTFSRIDLFPEKKVDNTVKYPKSALCDPLTAYGITFNKPTKTPIATIEVW